MNISILGCGWLGFPLAQRLLSEGYNVKGSTTTEEKVRLLKQNGIESCLISLPEDLESVHLETFLNTDVLFLNLPPGASDNHSGMSYQTLIQSIVKKALTQKVSWIIFTSSTSVYNETGGFVTEEDANIDLASKPNGVLLMESEEAVQKSGIDYTILRLGGLYGYGRHPIRYLSGKKDLEGASKPVNLIHQLDCINITIEIITQRKRNEIYNLVSDGHPPRKEFYESAARYYKLQPPKFKADPGSNYKVVSNKKVKRDLFYSFSYPNPMDHTP